MNNQSLWYLENVDLTGLLCPQKLSKGALDAHEHKSFDKGEYIYLPDEYADRMFFITDGRVKIGTYSGQGKEIAKAILGPGEVFGELSLIGKDRRHDFAYAMEDTQTCVLTVSDVKAMMRVHSAFGLFLLKTMGSRMLDMEQRFQSLVFKDSRTRVLEFLLGLAREKGQRVGYEVVVRKFMTHQEMANLTATSRQTVTTILNELRNKNILTFDRRRLLIRNIEALQQEAQNTAS
ncbi:Crp/Fnr family transcriptional regulator [Phaeodactylibacter luteus]|uniref:Crp/Fnr family transcriptional regulator n=1 Tax=Phaeodactylibacter luteus TaxID=1564516 RepID=A0A5C6RIX0_9BACT|nr:Crp/Fnr family transcriptional regulator [Phaeodactylibacter luteus]TXB62147.1 Crp/Fnr family transcriptional regulator [Phaeodactylibacter luteus]